MPLPSMRALLWVAAVVLLPVLAYGGARATSVFAVHALDVRGAPADVRAEVRTALAPVLGESLVGLGEGDLTRRLERLPSVRSVRIDRAFPSTLRVLVRPEEPLAVVRRGREAWLVSERGRLIRSIGVGEERLLPRVWLRAEERLRTGQTLADANARLALRALARLPADFPARVTAARGDGSIALVLAGGAELRLGDDNSLRLKLEAAASVLAALGRPERGGLDYLDVSLPERPVAIPNPQLEGTG